MYEHLKHKFQKPETAFILGATSNRQTEIREGFDYETGNIKTEEITLKLAEQTCEIELQLLRI
jgi:hypothetical protein